MNTLTNARKTKSVPANSCDGLVKRIQANRTRYLRVFHHNIVLLHFLLRHCTRPVHFHVPGLSLQTDNIVQRRARRVCEVLKKRRRRSDEIIAEEEDGQGQKYGPRIPFDAYHSLQPPRSHNDDVT